MELLIKENQEGIIVAFGKTRIEISQNSTQWNNEGINNFLIKLASSTPDEDKIIITADKESENEVYKHIVALFTEFATEYNKHVVEEMEF